MAATQVEDPPEERPTSIRLRVRMKRANKLATESGLYTQPSCNSSIINWPKNKSNYHGRILVERSELDAKLPEVKWRWLSSDRSISESAPVTIESLTAIQPSSDQTATPYKNIIRTRKVMEPQICNHPSFQKPGKLWGMTGVITAKNLTSGNLSQHETKAQKDYLTDSTKVCMIQQDIKLSDPINLVSDPSATSEENACASRRPCFSSSNTCSYRMAPTEAGMQSSSSASSLEDEVYDDFGLEPDDMNTPKGSCTISSGTFLGPFSKAGNELVVKGTTAPWTARSLLTAPKLQCSKLSTANVREHSSAVTTFDVSREIAIQHRSSGAVGDTRSRNPEFLIEDDYAGSSSSEEILPILTGSQNRDFSWTNLIQEQESTDRDSGTQDTSLMDSLEFCTSTEQSSAPLSGSSVQAIGVIPDEKQKANSENQLWNTGIAAKNLDNRDNASDIGPVYHGPQYLPDELFNDAVSFLQYDTLVRHAPTIVEREIEILGLSGRDAVVLDDNQERNEVDQQERYEDDSQMPGRTHSVARPYQKCGLGESSSQVDHSSVDIRKDEEDSIITSERDTLPICSKPDLSRKSVEENKEKSDVSDEADVQISSILNNSSPMLQGKATADFCLKAFDNEPRIETLDSETWNTLGNQVWTSPNTKQPFTIFQPEQQDDVHPETQLREVKETTVKTRDLLLKPNLDHMHLTFSQYMNIPFHGKKDDDGQNGKKDDSSKKPNDDDESATTYHDSETDMDQATVPEKKKKCILPSPTTQKSGNAGHDKRKEFSIGSSSSVVDKEHEFTADQSMLENRNNVDSNIGIKKSDSDIGSDSSAVDTDLSVDTDHLWTKNVVYDPAHKDDGSSNIKDSVFSDSSAVGKNGKPYVDQAATITKNPNVVPQPAVDVVDGKPNDSEITKNGSQDDQGLHQSKMVNKKHSYTSHPEKDDDDGMDKKKKTKGKDDDGSHDSKSKPERGADGKLQTTDLTKQSATDVQAEASETGKLPDDHNIEVTDSEMTHSIDIGLRTEMALAQMADDLSQSNSDLAVQYEHNAQALSTLQSVLDATLNRLMGLALSLSSVHEEGVKAKSHEMQIEIRHLESLVWKLKDEVEKLAFVGGKQESRQELIKAVKLFEEMRQNRDTLLHELIRARHLNMEFCAIITSLSPPLVTRVAMRPSDQPMTSSSNNSTPEVQTLPEFTEEFGNVVLNNILEMRHESTSDSSQSNTRSHNNSSFETVDDNSIITNTWSQRSNESHGSANPPRSTQDEIQFDDIPATESHSNIFTVPADSDISHGPADSDISHVPADSDISHVPADSDISHVPADSDISHVLADSDNMAVPGSSTYTRYTQTNQAEDDNQQKALGDAVVSPPTRPVYIPSMPNQEAGSQFGFWLVLLLVIVSLLLVGGLFTYTCSRLFQTSVQNSGSWEPVCGGRDHVDFYGSAPWFPWIPIHRNRLRPH